MKAIHAHLRGTQAAWDQAENCVSLGTNGLHIFSPHESVRRNDGTVGQVIARTPLTARIAWENGQVTEVEQFAEDVWVIQRR